MATRATKKQGLEGKTAEDKSAKNKKDAAPLGVERLPVTSLEGFAPAPPIPRPAMRLRAHGVLVFSSKKALDAGVRGFDGNAYVEWYSAEDLVIEDRVVKVDIETDLEVDCVSFGVSFRELARHASGGAVVVAWDDQVTSMRFSALSYGEEVVVPELPPGARARYGRVAERLIGAAVTDGRGAFAAPSGSGVMILDERGAVTSRVPCAAPRMIALDEECAVVLGARYVSEDREQPAVQRIDRATCAVVRSADAPGTMNVTRAVQGGAGGFFLFYEENRAQLWDTTPRSVAAVKLAKSTYILDAAVDSSGELVALATSRGLYLWEPSKEGPKDAESAGLGARHVPGVFSSVAFLPGGEIAALGSTDPTVKNTRAFIARIGRGGEVIETVKTGKEIEKLTASPTGVLGSYEYNDVLSSFGPDLARRFQVETGKKSGCRELVPTPDGRALLMVSGAGVFTGLDAETAAPLTGHAMPVTAMDASGDVIATMGEDGDLIVRARRTGEVKLRHRLTLKAEKSAHVVFFAGGLAVADSDRLVVAGVADGGVRALEKSKLTSAARYGEGRLVTGHADGKVRFMEGSRTRVVEAGGDVRRVAVSASGERFACLFKDGTAAVFDGGGVEGPDGGTSGAGGAVKKKREVKASRDFATLVLSPDGRTLVFVRSQKERYSVLGEVVLMDVESGVEHVVMRRCRPEAAIFSRGGGRLFVADGRYVRIVGWTAGEPGGRAAVGDAQVTGTLAGHAGEVKALAVPEDGTLMSAAADQTVLEWDLAAIEAMGGGHPREETGMGE